MKLKKHIKRLSSVLCLFISLFMVLCLFVTGINVYADDETEDVDDGIELIGQDENFLAVVYDNTNGLTSSDANDIAQTEEGFIWIGSYGGLTEATNTQKEMFGLERIPKVLNIDVDVTVEQTIHNMKSAVNDFVKDEEQFDDLTLMCMEYKGPQE